MLFVESVSLRAFCCVLLAGCRLCYVCCGLMCDVRWLRFTECELLLVTESLLIDVCYLLCAVCCVFFHALCVLLIAC